MWLEERMAFELAAAHGTPLYVYSEAVLRERCRELLAFMPGLSLRVNYSAKANTNPHLMRIAFEEGLDVDAMSPGEIELEQMAGFSPDRIFYIGNNVSDDEMRFAVERGILVSVDSLDQLRRFGEINPGGRVAVRFNPGEGAGHHEKVVTAGKKTKFGVTPDSIPAVRALLSTYNLKLAAINQHIGSLFLTGDSYVNGVRNLLAIARAFPGLEFIDFGGGFGVPYRPGENRLDLAALGAEMNRVIKAFLADYDNPEVTFRVEPGRYVVAESGILLGTVHAVKENYGVLYLGTDLGFNVLARPVMYDAYHEINVLKARGASTEGTREATVVGNICETGDVLARDRALPHTETGDLVAVMNAGAYGYSMSSNYNCRLRPAEVLIGLDGKPRVIRNRETLEDLKRGIPGL